MNNWTLKIKTIFNCIINIEYLGINITKDVQDLCNENYNSLLKETKGDIHTWKDTPCLLVRRLTTDKMSKFFPNWSTNSLQSQPKSQ